MPRFPSLALALGLAFSTTVAAEAAPAPWSSLHRPRLVLGDAPLAAGFARVGREGAEWALPGGARLIAEAGSVLLISKSSQRLDLGKRDVLAHTVTLKSGAIRARVPEGSPAALIVSAPRKAIALLTRGEAMVLASDQAVVVANAEGETSLGVGGKRYHAIGVGTSAVLDKTGESSRPLLAAPSALSGCTVLLSYGEPASLGGFSWAPVPSAAGYRVELRDATTNHLVARTRLEESALPAASAALAPGAYSLRVVALDATGLESAIPLERAVRVLGVQLPEGGYRDGSGSVRFPRGYKVALSNTDGVEMTYGSGRDFVPAPAELELLQSEPRLVRFRSGDDPALAQLLLLPRSAQAKVEFGSRSPRWPGAPLEIRVHLADAGADIPSWLEPRAKVTVGVEPVEVEFAREGGTLVGTLMPRPGPGPWVVRVEVADQLGFELGRDFVEVSPAPRARPASRAELAKRSVQREPG